jgi:hypothetical protein
MTSTQPAAAPATGGYPVQLSVTSEREINRLWGIPYLGMLVRMILVIPHLVVVMVLAIGLYIWILLGWVPILVYGRVPAIAVQLVTELLHRYLRVCGYALMLMPGPYPPLERGSPIPVALQVNLPSLQINRLWGIPFLGLFVRYIAAIPHLVVLAFFAIGVYLSLLVLWIPILIKGRYPEFAANLYRRFMVYAAGVAAYILLMPVPYPPFPQS